MVPLSLSGLDLYEGGWSAGGAGPAPRSLDVFPLQVKQDLSVVVQTGRQFEGSGSSHNPSRAAPYEPGSQTPP